MKSFQTIVLVVFIALLALSIVVFSLFSKDSESDAEAELLMWGILPEKAINDFLKQERLNNDAFPQITYIEKDAETYEGEIIGATARGQAPDIFIIRPENIPELEDLIFAIPFSSYPERVFKDNFIEHGELFIKGSTITAFPLAVDPMVMYWNRNIFRSSGLGNPPRFWDELITMAPRITEKDEARNIERSAFALGEYDNINHAKEIISTIIFVSGGGVTRRDISGNLRSVIGERVNSDSPAESALRFYTEFSNPSKTTYSWNRSLPEALDAFVSARLAVYFGFGSEFEIIRAKNPNLDFDIAVMPQIRDFDNRSLYGRIYGMSVSKSTKNLGPAIRALGVLSGRDGVLKLSEGLALSPSRRDILSVLPTDAIGEVFYRSALISNSFIEPQKDETEKVFKEMIEAVTSGRLKISEAVSRAGRELEELIAGKR